jgi:hypothetical protein
MIPINQPAPSGRQILTCAEIYNSGIHLGSVLYMAAWNDLRRVRSIGSVWAFSLPPDADYNIIYRAVRITVGKNLPPDSSPVFSNSPAVPSILKLPFSTSF